MKAMTHLRNVPIEYFALLTSAAKPFARVHDFQPTLDVVAHCPLVRNIEIWMEHLGRSYCWRVLRVSETETPVFEEISVGEGRRIRGTLTRMQSVETSQTWT